MRRDLLGNNIPLHGEAAELQLLKLRGGVFVSKERHACNRIERIYSTLRKPNFGVRIT
jgi:hypothetical protein